MEEILAILRRVPRFAGLTARDVVASRLGGLTNQNWKLEIGQEVLVLRVAGAGTSDYIDRANEDTNARAAAAAGVGAEVLHCEPTTGVLLARFIPGAVTMTAALFKERAGSPQRAALALRQMHQSGQLFAKRFELFAMIEEYKAVLAKRGATLPDGYEAAVVQAGAVKTALEAAPVALAPCHCDPLCENFLDDGQRMWVVDWEYSGMNDPYWDLGDLSVEADFTAQQDEELMHAYCGGAPAPWQQGRMVIYKAMCDLLWTLWGLIQHTNKNPADDFWAYASLRFARCRALMATPSFARHLSAITAA